MAHCRQQIRDALIAGFTSMTTVATVQTARTVSLDPNSIPALVVFTDEESVEDINKSNDISRLLTVTVEGQVQGGPVLDTLDDIAEEMEPLFYSSLPEWIKEAELKSTSIEIIGDPVDPVGLMRIVFEVFYIVNRAAPAVPL